MNYFLQYDFNFTYPAEVEKRVEERKRQKLKEENEGLDQLIEEVSERVVSEMTSEAFVGGSQSYNNVLVYFFRLFN